MRYQDQIAVVLAEAIYNNSGVYVLPICVTISKLVDVMPINYGKSKYARRRRARAIGRCVRCYRVSPPIGASKCNGVSCVPGITFNSRVAEHIWEGVTEVIPLPDVAQSASCS